MPRPPAEPSRGAASSIVLGSSELRPCPGRSRNAWVGVTGSVLAIEVRALVPVVVRLGETVEEDEAVSHRPGCRQQRGGRATRRSTVTNVSLSWAPGTAHSPLTTYVGTAEMPRPAACSMIGPDLRRAPVRVEERQHLVPIEPHLGCARRQGVGITDVEAVDEVRLEQSFLELGLRHRRVGLLGEPEQAVGEQRVGAQGALEVELEAVVGCHAGDVPDDLVGPLGAAELLRVRLDDRLRRTGCCGGVELIRLVAHGDVDLTGQLGDGTLEPPLADVAPGAHDVAPDLDLDRRRRCGGSGCHRSHCRPLRSRPSARIVSVHEPRHRQRERDGVRDARRRMGAVRCAPRGRRPRFAQHPDGVGPGGPCRAGGARRARRARRCVRRARSGARRRAGRVAVHEWHGCRQLPPGRGRGRPVRRGADRAHRRPSARAAWRRGPADDRPDRAVRALGALVPRRPATRRRRPRRVAPARPTGVQHRRARAGAPEPAVPRAAARCSRCDAR